MRGFSHVLPPIERLSCHGLDSAVTVARAATAARTSSVRDGLGIGLGMVNSPCARCRPPGFRRLRRHRSSLQHMAGREDLVRPIAGWTRVGVDLHLAVVHVDDPVDGDTRFPVDLGQLPVFIQARDRHLGDQRAVRRLGVSPR